MMELLWSFRRPMFNMNFFNNMKTHNGNKENVTSSSHGYDKLMTSEDAAIDLQELGPAAGDAALKPATKPDPEEPATPDADDFSATDDEDDRTCIVCDLTFITRKHLRYHQKKKRHYGCSVCEDVFASRIALEYHKEESDHWTVSDDEDEFMNQPDDDVMESEDDEQLLFY